MKVLFMDIDGVLNSNPYLHQLTFEQIQDPVNCIERDMVERMNRVLEDTGAKVVVSSAWREDMPIHMLREVLAKVGFTGEIIDYTPSMRRLNSLGHRGSEIRKWLDENEDDLGVETFAIVDDFMDMGSVLRKRTVYTDSFYGMQDHDALKLRDMLLSKGYK